MPSVNFTVVKSSIGKGVKRVNFIQFSKQFFRKTLGCVSYCCLPDQLVKSRLTTIMCRRILKVSTRPTEWQKLPKKSQNYP